METQKKLSYALGALLLASVLTPSFARAETTTCALDVNKPYRTRGNSTVYYVSADCTKRPMKDPEVYFSYFSAWNEVRYVSDAQLWSVPNNALGFLPWGPHKVFEQGTIVKTTTVNKVYILLNGE